MIKIWLVYKCEVEPGSRSSTASLGIISKNGNILLVLTYTTIFNASRCHLVESKPLSQRMLGGCYGYNFQV